MSGVTHEDVALAATRLVEQLENEGLTARLVGGAGIWTTLSPAVRPLYEASRPAPADIDLLTPPKTGKDAMAAFGRLGLEGEERFNLLRGNVRQKWYLPIADGKAQLSIDVFVGDPPLCHQIDFSQRLTLTSPAMSATDLLLQKLQIVEINEKDLVDITHLILERDEGAEAGQIDCDRIVELVRDDWGFYHTMSVNLEKAEAAMGLLSLPEAVRAGAFSFADLRERIEAAPKTLRWKMRAKVGTKKRWYEEVEEVDR